LGNVVNLRQARKQARREQDAQRAAANRLRHGLSKAEHKLEAAREGKARLDLDRRRVETGDER